VRKGKTLRARNRHTKRRHPSRGDKNENIEGCMPKARANDEQGLQCRYCTLFTVTHHFTEKLDWLVALVLPGRFRVPPQRGVASPTDSPCDPFAPSRGNMEHRHASRTLHHCITAEGILEGMARRWPGVGSGIMRFRVDYACVVLALALRCCLGWQCTYLNDFASNCTLHHRFSPNYTCFPVGCLRRRPGGGRKAEVGAPTNLGAKPQYSRSQIIIHQKRIRSSYVYLQ
jgi:hypothetical protein